MTGYSSHNAVLKEMYDPYVLRAGGVNPEDTVDPDTVVTRQDLEGGPGPAHTNVAAVLRSNMTPATAVLPPVHAPAGYHGRHIR